MKRALLAVEQGMQARASGPMAVTFLGTASQAPSRTRNVSGAALRLASGAMCLIDCGEATQHHARLATSVRLSRVDYIFLTHMHGGPFHRPPVPCRPSEPPLARARGLAAVLATLDGPPRSAPAPRRRPRLRPPGTPLQHLTATH